MHIPPPFYFATAFLVGITLNRWLPGLELPEAWGGVRVLLGFGLMLIAAGGGGWAIATFWRYRTPVIPGRPAKAMVQFSWFSAASSGPSSPPHRGTHKR